MSAIALVSVVGLDTVVDGRDAVVVGVMGVKRMKGVNGARMVGVFSCVRVAIFERTGVLGSRGSRGLTEVEG